MPQESLSCSTILMFFFGYNLFDFDGKSMCSSNKKLHENAERNDLQGTINEQQQIVKMCTILRKDQLSTASAQSCSL